MTQSKTKQPERREYPQCPECGQTMVWTFAFPYNEYACLPCDIKAPMFNGLKKVERSVKYMSSKRNKWEKDLSVIARRTGGGSCSLCVDGSCDWCIRANDKDYQFEFWKKNETN